VVAPTTKMPPLKNHPKDILHDKNHLYGIILVDLSMKNSRKHFKVAGYAIFKLKIEIWSVLLTLVASLRDQTKQQMAMILHHNALPFGVPTSVLPLCLELSFIFHQIVLLFHA